MTARVGAFLLGFAALAPNASAATVSVGEPPNEDLKAAVRYQAAPGEVNRVAFAVEPSGVMTVEDASAPLVAGPGCTVLGPRAVRCTDARFVDSAVVDLGDLDDEARIAVPRRSRLHVELQGGPGRDLIDAVRAALPTGVMAGGGDGDDRLEGGPARDVLDGGPGADVLSGRSGEDTLSGDAVIARDPIAVPGPPGDDVLDGGAGEDTASYVDRRAPVVADLKRGRAGQRGERDRLSGIENLVGGWARDVLRGDDGPNVLSAVEYFTHPRAGDVLVGRGGDDRLEATSQRTRMHGGRGDDVLDPTGRSARLRCGPGMDRVAALADGTTVPGDCDWVDVANVLYSRIAMRRGRAVVRVRIVGGIEWCAGTIALRSPAGRPYGRVRWGTGEGRSFRSRLRLSIPLTPAGREAAARHRLASVQTRDRCTDAHARWRTPL